MTTPENHTNHLKDNQSEGRSTWHGFKAGRWQTEIDVRDFIQKNYTPYEGDASFLCGPTERTATLWQKILELLKEEGEKVFWMYLLKLDPALPRIHRDRKSVV